MTTYPAKNEELVCIDKKREYRIFDFKANRFEGMQSEVPESFKSSESVQCSHNNTNSCGLGKNHSAKNGESCIILMLRRQAQGRKRNLCARLRSLLDSLHGGLLHTTRVCHTNSRLDSFRGGIHVGGRRLESNCHRYDERCCRKIMVHNL